MIIGYKTPNAKPIALRPKGQRHHLFVFTRRGIQCPIVKQTAYGEGCIIGVQMLANWQIRRNGGAFETVLVDSQTGAIDDGIPF